MLPPAHRVTFSASCCERLLPNYEGFSLKEAWGDYNFLRKTLDKIWEFAAADVAILEAVPFLRKRCEALAPDTEDFSSVLTSPALDAVSALVETLDCCITGSAESSVRAATSAHDTIYMYIQSRDHLEYDNLDFEQEIYGDPLMIEEMEAQRSDIDILRSNSLITPQLLQAIRQSSAIKGLQPVFDGRLREEFK